MVVAIDVAKSSPSMPNGLSFSSSRIARTTAFCAASSKPMNSLQVIVNALPGAGAPEVGDVLVGADVVGRDVVGRVVAGPGWVVIATLPGTVRSQPGQRPRPTTAAATANRRMRICETINASGG